MLTVDELTGICALTDVSGHFQISQPKDKVFFAAVTAVIVTR